MINSSSNLQLVYMARRQCLLTIKEVILALSKKAFEFNFSILLLNHLVVDCTKVNLNMV